jgi:hypothetical protein
MIKARRFFYFLGEEGFDLKTQEGEEMGGGNEARVKRAFIPNPDV